MPCVFSCHGNNVKQGSVAMRKELKEFRLVRSMWPKSTPFSNTHLDPVLIVCHPKGGRMHIMVAIWNKVLDQKSKGKEVLNCEKMHSKFVSHVVEQDTICLPHGVLFKQETVHKISGGLVVANAALD